ncbi:MAG: hypothetical protein ACRCWJ_21805 [Casimicrobium sp.]
MVCRTFEVALVAVATFFATLSFANTLSQFDAAQLDGEWSEVVAPKHACKSDTPRVKFKLSDDRKTLAFSLSEKILLTNGKESDKYDAAVLKEEPHALFIRYPDADLSKAQAEWEMRVIGPGVYRWRSLAWKEGTYNGVIGVRCGR